MIRVLFAVFAIPIALFLVFYGGVVLKLFLVMFLVGSGIEFFFMFRNRGRSPFLPALLIGILAFALTMGNIIAESGNLIFFLLAIAVGFMAAFEVYKAEPEGITDRAGSTALGILYIGVMGSYLLLIPELPLPEPALRDMLFRGVPLVLLLLSIWSSDSLAFFFGKYLGKKLLLPKASPKKTVMGLYGSIIGGALGIVIGRYFLKFDILALPWAIIIGAILGFLGQIGDLFESLLKRHCGVKDSSSLFPGHGGILDRIDALIFCAPVYYYLMRLCT